MTASVATGPVFDQLVGQAEAVALLAEAVRAAAEIVDRTGDGAQMTHAWLFVGPPGSGRSVAARAFAAALQCEFGGCGVCQSCHTVLVGTHADVHVVSPAGLSISVREIRQIVRISAYHPSGRRWQIVIIEDSDRLTEGAANALLKAIEEPSARTVFLLCAPTLHPDDVSVTIRSRCRVVSLRTPSAVAIAEVLTTRDGIDPGIAEWAALAASGHVGRAKRLATDETARSRRTAVLRIPALLSSMQACLASADILVSSAEEDAKAISATLDGPEREALSQSLGAGGTGKGAGTATRGSAGALKELERTQRNRGTRVQRDALDRALVDLTGFYRDVLALQVGATVALSHEDHRADAEQIAATVEPAWTLGCLEAIVACRDALDLNVKPRVALGALTVTLRLPRR